MEFWLIRLSDNGAFYKVYSEKLSLDTVYSILKDEGYHGKKKNWRLMPLDDDAFRLETNYPNGEWRPVIVIPKRRGD